MSATESLVIERLIDGRAGLRVIGDVQGQSDEFAVAIREARRNNLGVLQLGDITDRGPDSPGAIRLMLDLLDRGDGAFIGGNHDLKFMRWAQGRNVQIDARGLAGTICQLEEASDGNSLREEFSRACAAAPVWLHTGKDFFVHGAFDVRMLQYLEGPTLENIRSLDSSIVNSAIYAETDGTKTESGLPVRTYNWVDAIPRGLTVHVGHDVRSTTHIVEQIGRGGGTAVFLDTGAGGKNGPLSWKDIPAERLLVSLRMAREAIATRNSASTGTDRHKGPDMSVLVHILCGPSGAGKTTWANKNFPADAIVSTDAIRSELSRRSQAVPAFSDVMEEVRRRAETRIAAGLPVVMDAAHLNAKVRKSIVSLVPAGARVSYVIMDRPMEQKQKDAAARADGASPSHDFMAQQQSDFEKRLPDMLRGDGLPNVEVMDLRHPLSISRYREKSRAPKNDKCR